MLLMAPRRDSNSANSSSSILVQHQLPQSQQQQQPQQSQQHIQAFLYSTSLYNGANLLESNNGSTLITNNSNSDNINTNNNLSNSSNGNNINILNNSSNINMSPMQTGNLTHATLNGTTSTGGTTSGIQNGHHPHHIVSNISNNNNISNNVNVNVNGNIHDQYTRCCYPNGECLKLDGSCLIGLDDLSDTVRVLCNNENCNMGQYMHRECFEAWEQAVLVTLKTMGRARSWSDRQRTQNLWTKKGYDLVYKACVCKCGHGHIRKDLEWTPPVQKSSATLNGGQFGNVNGNTTAINGGVGQPRVLLVNGGNVNNIGGGNATEDDDKKKKKKRNRNNGSKSTMATVNSNGLISNGQQQQVQLSPATTQAQHSLQQQQQATQVANQQPQQQQSANSMLNGQQNSNGNISNGISAICTPNNVNKTNGNLNTANNAINNNQINALNNSSVGVIGSGLHNNTNSGNLQQQQSQQQQQAVASLNNILGLDLRARADSLSSSGGGSGSTSPSASHSSADISISPIHQNQQHQQQQPQQQLQQHQQNNLQLQQYQQSLLQQNNLTKSILNGALNGCVDTIQRSTTALLAATQPQQPAGTPIVGGIGAVNGLNGLKQLSVFDPHLVQQQKNKEVELYSERVRLTSGCNGIFSRRLDFSSFNLLPKTRLNSYQVKIEDEGNHGNDETRLFILSSLAQSQMSRVACILCEEPMLVFDRYPLVDGSFFLSPKQHSNGCIEVKYEGRPLFLTCVCMACLDGTSTNRVINCRFCGEIWDGSNLVLGTMYSYDIFAAMPCCAERLKCNNCFKLLLHPQQRLNFYSDYSHCVTCPYCATQDTHFVKPLSFCYTKSNVSRHQSIA
ncbi:headcase protein isoform X1 [Bactrocera oleae]|uniref:headcase protein isoform X1 n=1 Tax=Bactrocera oleae TaxID=104688 RepID=UPI00387E8FC0